jgi:hypothetical protein
MFRPIDEQNFESTDEKPNDDSIDKETEIKLDQTDEEVEVESLNKDPIIEHDDEEQPITKFAI